MVEEITREELLKRTAIRMARDHRKTCSFSGCNISLSLLAALLDMAKIELTPAEREEFI